MSTLDNLRRQIEEANTGIGSLLTELVALRARVTTLEAQVRSAQSTATTPASATRSTTPSAQTIAKTASVATTATNVPRSTTDKP